MAAGTTGLASPPYGASPADQVKRLVAQMSLEEKVGLCSSYFPHTSPRREELGMVFCSGYNPGVPRLGIPELRISDASMGVANILNRREGETSTALPSALAMAASFDPDLVRDASAMIGAEARDRTFNVLLAGGINLIRDPWAGRNFEYFSEDALLSGVLGGAAVEGVQSNRIVSTLKHYVLNSQETGRMVVDARIGMAALRESDLLAFQIAIERGRPGSIMAAYNKVNGEWASENANVIEILKGEWGYAGWLMSDWGGVHSTVKAANAGLDQESGLELDAVLNGAVYFTDRLAEAVSARKVPEARLDDMVTRILTGMLACGLMDNPVPAHAFADEIEAHSALAQQVAEAGIVLLRNEDHLLPLAANLRRIAVIGGNADVGVPSGAGSSQVYSHGGAPIERAVDSVDAGWFCQLTYHASSPLAAIRAAAPDAVVTYCSGEDPAVAARCAADADVAIVVATQWRSEAIDLETLSLPDGQDALIAAVAAANPRVVVVLETGGAVLMPSRDQVQAILAAWYPGQRGGEAIARVLFGQVNPSGRLPITFPADERHAPRALPCGLKELKARDAALAATGERLPIAPFAAEYHEGANVGYRWYEARGHEPLFPFGFGLSYTAFEYGDLVAGQGEPKARVTVRNVGDRAGADVLQVYAQAPDGEGLLTWRLAGFARVPLEAGEERTVEIDLEPRVYAQWNEKVGDWCFPPDVPLALGRSARDLVSTGWLQPNG
jgi:beta-glucosidase